MIVIRVNEVIVTRIAGRNEISVSRRTTCSGAEIVPIPFTWRSRLFTCGYQEHFASTPNFQFPTPKEPLDVGCWGLRVDWSPGRRSSVTSEMFVEAVSPSSRRRPSTATITSERRSPSGMAVSTATGLPPDASRASGPRRTSHASAATSASTISVARNVFNRADSALGGADDFGDANRGAVVDDDDLAIRDEHAVDDDLHVAAGRLLQPDDAVAASCAGSRAPRSWPSRAARRRCTQRH